MIKKTKAISYGLTFNLGNYESERMDMELDFPIDMPDVECYRALHDRIIRARQDLKENVVAT